MKDLEKLFTQLEAIGLEIEDYFLTQEESVSGEKLRTRYALTSDGGEKATVDVAGVGQLLNQILNLGKHGIEVKRFKGLGEMNSGELWETTLDPAKRTLMKVQLEDALKADEMFRTLMGEKVEPRRDFIQKYAIDVKDIDYHGA